MSTVYQQLDLVSKYGASQNQNVQASQGHMMAVESQKQLVENQSVQNANKNEKESKTNPDGHNNSSTEEEAENTNVKVKKEETEVPKKVYDEIKDPRLGQHIDITG